LTAKARELKLSRLLRSAVEAELARLDTINATLKGASQVELDLEDDNGNRYVGVLRGVPVTTNDSSVEAYLTDDERVLVYEPERLRVTELAEIDDLAGYLSDDVTVAVMAALGRKARVQL
jgi:hypothetical protein